MLCMLCKYLKGRKSWWWCDIHISHIAPFISFFFFAVTRIINPYSVQRCISPPPPPPPPPPKPPPPPSHSQPQTLSSINTPVSPMQLISSPNVMINYITINACLDSGRGVLIHEGLGLWELHLHLNMLQWSSYRRREA